MAMQMLNGDKGHGPVVLSLMRSASAASRPYESCSSAVVPDRIASLPQNHDRTLT